LSAGSPSQNEGIQAFNAKLGDELLAAKELIQRWRAELQHDLSRRGAPVTPIAGPI
jgi:hypothetical protein